MSRDAHVLDLRGETRVRIPPLESGDHLTLEEFERRYASMPHLKKAELIEGVVYVTPPVDVEYHGIPDFSMGTWLGHYQAFTPGVQGAANGSVRLDPKNLPQPDELLWILPECGGQARIGPDALLHGAPELAVEVAASSASYDLHSKKEAYRRNGVREYIVWRTYDAEIDWFVLRGGKYERLEADAAGILKSAVFPGLWLDAAALLRRDLRRVLEVLDAGLKSPEHAELVARLAAASDQR